MQVARTFDVQRMLQDFGGDRLPMRQLASSVASEVPHHIATMRDRLEAERLSGLEFSARYLAMLFDSLAAPVAAHAARSLENAARTRQRLEAEIAFECLENEVEDLLEDLSQV